MNILFLTSKVDKHARTYHREDRGRNVVLVWLTFICRYQQALEIYHCERGFELHIKYEK